jgi:hypothetical protein
MSLSKRNFLNTINGTNLNTETTKCTAPMINRILFTIRNDSMFGTDQFTAVTANTKRRDFKLDFPHNTIIGNK